MILSIVSICLIEIAIEVLLAAVAALLLYYKAYTEVSHATDRLLGYCLLSAGAVILSSAAGRLVWATVVEWRLKLLSESFRLAVDHEAKVVLPLAAHDERHSPFEAALSESESAEESLCTERKTSIIEALASEVVRSAQGQSSAPLATRLLLSRTEQQLFQSAMSASKELAEARAFMPHLKASIHGALRSSTASPLAAASTVSAEPLSARLRRSSLPPSADVAELLSAIKSPKLHASCTSSTTRPSQSDLSPPVQHAPPDSDSFGTHPTGSTRPSPHLSPKIVPRRTKSTFRRNTRVSDANEHAEHNGLNDSNVGRGTVMVVDIRSFMSDEDVPSEGDVHAVSGCLGRILVIIEQHGGVVYRFDTEKIVSTFHVQVPCPEHALMCVYAALEISKFLEEHSHVLTFGIGIAAGHFISGDVGTKELRTLIVVGRALQVAADLAALNFELQTRVLLTDSVQDEVQTATTTMLVDFVADERVQPYSENDTHETRRNPFCIFELRSDAPDLEHEPSPKIPGCRQLPHHVLVVYLEAFFMLRSGEFAKAADHLNNVADFLAVDPQLRRLQRLALFCASNSGSAACVPRPYYRRKYQLWDDVELSYATLSPASTRGPSPSFTRRSRQVQESPTRIIEAVIRARSSTPGNLDEDLLTSQASGFMNLSTDFVDISGVVWRKSEHLLGKGNFGEVFLGLRPDDGKLVAMKQLKIPGLFSATDVRNRRSAKKAEDELEALVSEIKLLCQLRHPNIVFFLGCAVVAHDIIINLEYVSGGSLQSMLRSFGSLPLSTVQRYVKDVLRGLQFLHSKNIIHLDLKPANVLLHVDGSCKVTDFGTSIQMHKLIDSNLVVGTPLYMSPEQARGVKYCSFQSDLWCLGLTVIEMLCGQLPFETNVNPFVHMRRLTSDESFKIEIPDELPASAHSFVAQCLQRDPAKRGSCDELLMHSFLFSSSTPMRHSKPCGDTVGRKSSGSLMSPNSASATGAPLLQRSFQSKSADGGTLAMSVGSEPELASATAELSP
jgi:serine/threonine protein kinase/class 3 adenylate cyclase